MASMSSPRTSPKKHHSKKTKLVYRSPTARRSSMSSSSRTAIIQHAEIPVFMLPHTDNLQATAIPEDSEIHEGFMVNLAVPPHRHSRFVGLESISDPDLSAIEQTATTAVEFRSFSCETALLA